MNSLNYILHKLISIKKLFVKIIKTLKSGSGNLAKNDERIAEILEYWQIFKRILEYTFGEIGLISKTRKI